VQFDQYALLSGDRGRFRKGLSVNRSVLLQGNWIECSLEEQRRRHSAVSCAQRKARQESLKEGLLHGIVDAVAIEVSPGRSWYRSGLTNGRYANTEAEPKSEFREVHRNSLRFRMQRDAKTQREDLRCMS